MKFTSAAAVVAVLALCDSTFAGGIEVRAPPHPSPCSHSPTHHPPGTPVWWLRKCPESSEPACQDRHDHRHCYRYNWRWRRSTTCARHPDHSASPNQSFYIVQGCRCQHPCSSETGPAEAGPSEAGSSEESSSETGSSEASPSKESPSEASPPEGQAC